MTGELVPGDRLKDETLFNIPPKIGKLYKCHQNRTTTRFKYDLNPPTTAYPTQTRGIIAAELAQRRTEALRRHSDFKEKQLDGGGHA